MSIHMCKSTVSGMTVGYYNGDDNSIAIRSGRGYTRSEKIKPDFVAPGVNVTGAAMRNQFTERTGSSVAVGITAGAVALMLEWIVYQLGESGIDSIQIRNLLVLGTDRKPGETYPNREWGCTGINHRLRAIPCVSAIMKYYGKVIILYLLYYFFHK